MYCFTRRARLGHLPSCVAFVATFAGFEGRVNEPLQAFEQNVRSN
jgi:hypothetical protein